MNKATKLLVAMAVALALCSIGLAQPTIPANYNGYTGFGQAIQTKNMPAGLVNEPGSQLIYLLDTGYDARKELSGNADYASKSVSDLDPDNASSAPYTNWISVTNTNPTEAVTVHFRYLASYRVWDSVAKDWVYNCEDLLDFLVVLTCNDTMLVDPFDYDIPGTTLNTKQRFFGSASAAGILKGIPAQKFDDGRFFLFVTASGDITNITADHPEAGDDYADWRYPRELAKTKSNGDIIGFADCDNQTKYIGAVKGINDKNLHILNASAVSFNFLTGFGTIAIPTAFLQGAVSEAAYGVTAYAIPAIDLLPEIVTPNNGVFGHPDGDGPPAPKWVILAGTENIPWSQKAVLADLLDPTKVRTNNYALRNEAHGGDAYVEVTVAKSKGGALGWTLFPIQGAVQGILPANQSLFMVSMVHDYNGRNNAKKSVTIPESDWSYGIDGAITEYQVLVYNNDEKLLKFDDPEIPVSPPPDFTQISININVRCFDAFDVAWKKEYDDLSIEDLHELGGQPLIDFLATPVNVNDEKGPGWIKFIRSPESRSVQNYDGSRPSFLTIAQQVNLFEGFGASWWTPTSAWTVVSNELR